MSVLIESQIFKDAGVVTSGWVEGRANWEKFITLGCDICLGRRGGTIGGQ